MSIDKIKHFVMSRPGIARGLFTNTNVFNYSVNLLRVFIKHLCNPIAPGQLKLGIRNFSIISHVGHPKSKKDINTCRIGLKAPTRKLDG